MIENQPTISNGSPFSLRGEAEAPNLSAYRYLRSSSDYGASTALFRAQPFIAYIVLVGCIFVVCCGSATWLSNPPTFSKVATAYAAVSTEEPLTESLS